MKLTQDIIRQIIKEELEKQMMGSDVEDKVAALFQQISQFPKADAVKIADKLRTQVAKLPNPAPAVQPGEESSPTNRMGEKLDKGSTAGEYVKDFRDSDAPQFKGKSKKKKQQMAIAAYLDAKDNK